MRDGDFSMNAGLAELLKMQGVDQSRIRVLQDLNDELRQQLATERAAREQAESKCATLLEHHHASEITLVQAVKEREQAEAKLAAAHAIMDKGANIGWGNAVTVEIERQQTLREQTERKRDALLAENTALKCENTYTCSKCGLRAHVDERPCPLCNARAELAALKAAKTALLFVQKEQREELQRDKARLDWLEKNIHYHGSFRSGGGELRRHAEINLVALPLRQAIDSAMSAVTCPRCGARSQQEADDGKCDGTGCDRSDQPQCASWLGVFEKMK